MDRYHKIFISHNNGLFNNTWCKKCEKCAFVLGAMFLFNQKSAETIWGDTKSVFNNEMRKCLLNLINPSQKPFECVGTLSENYYLLKNFY